jgi:hypothetical protein
MKNRNLVPLTARRKPAGTAETKTQTTTNPLGTVEG